MTVSKVRNVVRFFPVGESIVVGLTGLLVVGMVWLIISTLLGA